VKQTFIIVLTLAFHSTIFEFAAAQKESPDDPSIGIFQNREEYNAFFGGLKSLNDPEINAMIPALHDMTLGRPIGQTAREHGIGSNDGIMTLLTDENVRKELEIVDDQYQKLEQLNNELQKRVASQLIAVDLKNPSDVVAAIRGISTAAEDEFKRVFLPHQLDRLRQLSTQQQTRRRGIVEVLTTEPLVTELEISESQRIELKQSAKEIEAELARDIATLRAKARKKLISKLKTDQQKNWSSCWARILSSQKRSRKKPIAGNKRWNTQW
jgi:hypothetical protein